MKTDETLSLCNQIHRDSVFLKTAGCLNWAKMKKKKKRLSLCADVCEVSSNKVEGEHMGSSKQPDATNSAVQKFIFRVTSLFLSFIIKKKITSSSNDHRNMETSKMNGKIERKGRVKDMQTERTAGLLRWEQGNRQNK